MSLFLRQTLQLYMVRSIKKAAMSTRINCTELAINWKKLFGNALLKSNDIPKETWESMRKFVIESKVRPQSVDFFILKMCKQEKYLEAGISYYKYLENNNYNPTMATIVAYFELYEMKRDAITEADMDHILKLYNYITSQCQSLDHIMTTRLAITLCKIGKWEDAIKIIKKFEMTDEQFLRGAYSSLISCLFNSEKTELAFEYLISTFKTGIGPLDNTYNTYIQYCLKNKHKFNERVEILFNLWSKYGIKPNNNVLQEFIKTCNYMGWTAGLTKISSSECNRCKRILTQPDLTDEEYTVLSKTVLQNLILNKVYYVSNPDEINNYMQFIDENKPYDIVVDALNLLYSSYCGFNGLQRLLVNFKKQNKKTLVIGRHHIRKLLQAQKEKTNIDFFCVHNWSKDDAFILYAAFSSAKNTIIVSNDFMRQHKFALNNIELDALFKKWQASHQYVIKPHCKQITLHNVSYIDSIVHNEGDFWHIPYVYSQASGLKRHNSNTDWACFEAPPQ